MTSSDSLLNAVMALASEAILIIDVETLRYVAFNDATCRMTGRSREELDRLGPLGMWAEAGGSPQGLRNHYAELVERSPATMLHVAPMHRPDGSYIEVRMTRQARRVDGRWVILVCGEPVTGRDAPPVSTDIETLRREMHASQDAIALIDFRSMRYVDVNQATCDVLGYSREELLEGDLPLSGDRTLDDMQELYAGLVIRAPEAMVEKTTYHRSDGAQTSGTVTRRAILANGMWFIHVQVRIGDSVPAREPHEP